MQVVSHEVRVVAFSEPSRREVIADERVDAVVARRAVVDERFHGAGIERGGDADDTLCSLRGGGSNGRDRHAGKIHRRLSLGKQQRAADDRILQLGVEDVRPCVEPPPAQRRPDLVVEQTLCFELADAAAARQRAFAVARADVAPRRERGLARNLIPEIVQAERTQVVEVRRAEAASDEGVERQRRWSPARSDPH